MTYLLCDFARMSMAKRKQNKIAGVMHEYKTGTLHSGGNRMVKNRKQAIAIALNQASKLR